MTTNLIRAIIIPLHTSLRPPICFLLPFASSWLFSLSRCDVQSFKLLFRASFGKLIWEYVRRCLTGGKVPQNDHLVQKTLLAWTRVLFLVSEPLHIFLILELYSTVWFILLLLIVVLLWHNFQSHQLLTGPQSCSSSSKKAAVATVSRHRRFHRDWWVWDRYHTCFRCQKVPESS